MRQKNHIEGIRYVTCQAICVMYYENISLIQNCFYDTKNKLPPPPPHAQTPCESYT